MNNAPAKWCANHYPLPTTHYPLTTVKHILILILILLLMPGSAAQADMFSFRCLDPALSGYHDDEQDTYSRQLMQTGSRLSDNRRMAEVFAAMAVSTAVPRSDNMLTPTMGTVGFSKLSAAPMLLADGTVYSPSEATRPGPQRMPGTPGGIIDKPALPVGDPLLPLLLLAAAYAYHKYRRVKDS